MQKINFKNLPSTDTSINATNLNLMQDNIESAIDTVASDIPTIVDSLDGSSTTDAPSVHAVNEKIDSLNVYSTTERIVGKWIDGKPLYQKTIVYNNSTGLPSGNPSITHGISNIGSYRSVVRQSYIYNGNTYTGVSTSGSIVGVISIEPTVIYVSVSSNFANLFKLAYITLEYTKTTD